MLKKLNEISPDKDYFIKKINIDNNLKDRLNDIGLSYNSMVKMLFKSPFNDPKAYLINRSVISLRDKDACRIIVGDYND